MATLLLWFGVVCSLILALCYVFFALQGHGDRVNFRVTVIGIVVILAIAVFWYHRPSLPVHFLLPALVVRTLQMLQQLTEAIGTIVLIGLICFVILLLRLQATSDRASRGGEFPRSRFYRQIQHGTCAECGKPARPLAFYEYQYARGERVIDKLCRDCAVRFDAQRVHPPMSYADVD
jgi:hypothetical protein